LEKYHIDGGPLVPAVGQCLVSNCHRFVGNQQHPVTSKSFFTPRLTVSSASSLKSEESTGWTHPDPEPCTSTCKRTAVEDFAAAARRPYTVWSEIKSVSASAACLLKIL
jgi:hypothetical protein